MEFSEGIPLVIKQLLPLSNHSQEVVVQENDLNRCFGLHDGTQFLYGHLNPAITQYADHLSVVIMKLGTQRRGKRKTHCSQSSGGYLGTGNFIVEIPPGHH